MLPVVCSEVMIDAVKMMRELRDKLSREMEKMTPQEREQYIREKVAATTLGRVIAQDKAKNPK